MDDLFKDFSFSKYTGQILYEKEWLIAIMDLAYWKLISHLYDPKMSI